MEQLLLLWGSLLSQSLDSCLIKGTYHNYGTGRARGSRRRSRVFAGIFIG